MRLLLIAVLFLAGCATTPKVGPCSTTPCGDVCCNNDGKPCPPCWEKR